MTTIFRISTDWQARYHVQADGEPGAPLDGFLVELPPYVCDGAAPLLKLRDGQTMDDLWREALETLAWMRAQPHERILPRAVFEPFGVITALCSADRRRRREIKREMMLGACDDRERERMERINVRYSQEMHERRVASLCRALDLLNGAPLPVAGPCPELPVRH